MPNREPPINGVEILLVEDNPGDLELTTHALKKANLANHIHISRDGEDALEFLFGRGSHADRDVEAGPRLVMLDLKLPKVSGLEVLREIRANERTARLPVVMLTSSSQSRDLTEAYELNVNSYIVKPVNFDRFTEAVADIGMYWLLLNQAPA